MNKVKLNDGRFISYEIYGNPKGKPVFYFHGWPASCLSATPLHIPAQSLDLRIIALDRPGYGFSTFQPSRTLLDWPDDVIEIANYFKLKRFSIIGTSGGGPYVCACAYKIPQRITTAIITAGLGPLNNLTSHLEKEQQIYLYMWKWVYKLSLPILFFYNKTIRFWPSLYFFVTNTRRSKSDQQLFNKRSIRNLIISTAKRAFYQGFEGPWQDIKIYSNPWGFDLKNVNKKIFLWHGHDDKSVPLWIGKYVAQSLSNCQPHYLKNFGHMLLLTHALNILSQISSPNKN